MHAQYCYAGKVTGFGTQSGIYPESWSANQILGKPNVYPKYGYIEGLWITKNYNAKRDWISVGFKNSSPIDSIYLWESYYAGFVDSVFIKNTNTNQWQLVFSRKPIKHSMADTFAKILRIGFPQTTFNVNEVKLTVASDSADDEVGIDAIAIHPKTLSNPVVSNAAGSSLILNGSNAFYSTGYSTNSFGNNFTLIANVKATSGLSPVVGDLYKGNGIVYDGYFEWFGLVQANLGKGDSIYFFANFDRLSYVSVPIKLNNWQQIAVVNTPDSLKIYVDGVLQNTVAGGGYLDYFSYGLLEFGRSYYTSNFFKGELDEVKLFNKAMSKSEINTQLAAIGTSAITANLNGYWQFNESTSTGHWNLYTHLYDSFFRNVPNGIIKTNPRHNSLSIYPNPNNGQFIVQFATKNQNNMLVQILDLSGKIVYSGKLNIQNGTMSLNLFGLKCGIYFLKTEWQTLKFLIE